MADKDTLAKYHEGRILGVEHPAVSDVWYVGKNCLGSVQEKIKRLQFCGSVEYHETEGRQFERASKNLSSVVSPIGIGFGLLGSQLLLYNGYVIHNHINPANGNGHPQGEFLQFFSTSHEANGHLAREIGLELL